MTMVPPSKGYTVASPLWGLFRIITSDALIPNELLPRYGGYSTTAELAWNKVPVASPLWGLF